MSGWNSILKTLVATGSGLESRISELTNQIEQTSRLLEVTLANVQDEENALKEVQSTYKSLRRAIQNKMELNKLEQQQDAVKKFHADSLRSQIQARLSACIRTEEKIQKTIRKKRPELAVLKEQDRRVSMIWEVVFAKNKQKCVPEVQDVIEMAVEYAAAQKKNKMRPEEQDRSIQYPIRNKETLTSAVIPGKSSKYKQKDKEDNIFTLTPYSACRSSRTTKFLIFQNSVESRTACKDRSLKENPDPIGRPNWMHKLELFQHSRQSESTYLGAPLLDESLKENVNKARLPTRLIELEVPHRAVGNLSLSKSIRTLSFTDSHKEKLKTGLSSTPQAIQNKIEPLKDRSFSQCDQTTNSKLQSPVLPRPVILATPDTVEGSTNVLKKYDLQFTANLAPQNRSTNVEPVPEMIVKSDPSPNSWKRENKENEMPKEQKIRIVPVKQSGSLNEGSHLLKMWLQKKNEISAATSEVPKENATPEKRGRRSVEEEEKQPSDDCNKSLNQHDGYEICRSPASPHELMLQNIQSSMDHQKRKEVVAPNFVKSPSKIHLTPLSEVKRPSLSEENTEAHIEKQEESLKSSHDISNAEAKGFNSSIQPDKASDFVFDFAEKAHPIQFAQDFFFGAVPGTETAATEGMVFSFAFASEDSSTKANEIDPFSFFND